MKRQIKPISQDKRATRCGQLTVTNLVLYNIARMAIAKSGRDCYLVNGTYWIDIWVASYLTISISHINNSFNDEPAPAGTVIIHGDDAPLIPIRKMFINICDDHAVNSAIDAIVNIITTPIPYINHSNRT